MSQPFLRLVAIGTKTHFEGASKTIASSGKLVYNRALRMPAILYQNSGKVSYG